MDDDNGDDLQDGTIPEDDVQSIALLIFCVVGILDPAAAALLMDVSRREYQSQLLRKARSQGLNLHGLPDR